jgi:hypothetical protein
VGEGQAARTGLSGSSKCLEDCAYKVPVNYSPRGLRGGKARQARHLGSGSSSCGPPTLLPLRRVETRCPWGDERERRGAPGLLMPIVHARGYTRVTTRQGLGNKVLPGRSSTGPRLFRTVAEWVSPWRGMRTRDRRVMGLRQAARLLCRSARLERSCLHMRDATARMWYGASYSCGRR